MSPFCSVSLIGSQHVRLFNPSVSLGSDGQNLVHNSEPATELRKKMAILSGSISETISRNIAAKLDSCGWTTYRLWKEVGGSKPGLYRVCSGEGSPSVGLLRDIAAALNCTMDELVADR